MRGSVDYQINRIFMESGIFRPGESRHAAKESAKQLIGGGSTMTSTELAAHTRLNSYTYTRDCKDTWHSLGRFAHSAFRLKDMTAITGCHVEAYLMKRMADGISYPSWKKEAAHLGKLENALLGWNKAHAEDSLEPDIRTVTQDAELRTLARETLRTSGKKSGHFQRPELVIGKLEAGHTESLFVVARIQLEGGARCREACLINRGQLYGIENDPFTGVAKGQVHLNDTKGGKPRTIQISPELYGKLEMLINIGDGVLRANRNTYAAAVRVAAREAGESLTGTHAFRYCFARRRYKELTSLAGGAALNHEAALQQVSWEMGHERASITMLYLR